MTYEETIAHLQDKIDEHDDVLHRTLTLVDKLHDMTGLRCSKRVRLPTTTPRSRRSPGTTHTEDQVCGA